MRRRRSRRLGKKLPVRSFGMASSRSPACVVTVFSRCPLRQVVRVSVCSPHSAPIFVVASASISSCSSRSATSRTSSRPSAERSDSSRRSRSCWDKATVHPLGSNCPFTPDSCTVACQLSREQTPADGAPEGAEPAHSTAEIPYTTQRDAIHLGGRRPQQGRCSHPGLGQDGEGEPCFALPRGARSRTCRSRRVWTRSFGGTWGVRTGAGHAAVFVER